LTSKAHDRRHARVVTVVLTFLMAFGALAGVAAAAPSAAADPKVPAAVDGKQAAKDALQARAADVGVQDICNYTAARPTVRLGSSGAAVKQAQCYVYHSVRDADLAIDGQFGAITRNWVITFQRCAGIGVDGIVGAQTWSQLFYWANATSFVC
jgi:zinc D-Ala-D-Ala carboxypeptidase